MKRKLTRGFCSVLSSVSRGVLTAFFCLAGSQAFAACTDTIPPVLVGVPANTNVQCLVDVPPPANVTAVDNVDGALPVTTSYVTNGSCPMTITCQWIAQDSCTNTASATRTIVVLDTIPPILVGVPGNTNVQCLSDVPPPALVTAIDNCEGGIPVTTTYVTNGSCPMVITCTWIARDRCTNSASATRTIQVHDTIPPILVGVPGNTNVQCLADLPPPALVTATDNCDGNIPVTTSYVTNGSCPTVITCTWFARDQCTNSASATRTIRVHDTIPPILVGIPSEPMLQCSPDGPTVTAVDNCDGTIPVTMTAVTNGNNPVSITFTWRAQDRCTNSASATRTFNLQDTIPPVIQCPPDRVVRSLAEVPCPGSLSGFIAAGGAATDQCDAALDYRCSDGPLMVDGCHRTVHRTHTVIDDNTNSAACVQVLTINQPPECVAGITPLACGAAFGDPTNLVVISLNHSNACVILDGSRTTDPENDPLTFSWSEGGNLLGIGPVVTNCMSLGCHTLTFTASDCVESCSQTLPVCVVTACEAVEACIALVESSSLIRRERRPLIATLKAACASFERDNFTSGLNQLEAFQNKVRAQLSRSWPAEAQALMLCVQQVIDAIECAVTVQDALNGNNGLGNGLDPQPPGNPPVNDGPGTGPGSPAQ